MNRIFCLLTMLALSNVGLRAQQYQNLSIDGPVQQGSQIELKYRTASGPLIQTAGGHVIAIMTAYQQGKGFASDTIMQQFDKGILFARWQVPQHADLLVFRFMDEYEQSDNNKGKGYVFPVLDQYGKTITATDLSLSAIYRGAYYAGVQPQDAEVANDHLRRYIGREKSEPQLTKASIDLAYFTKDTSALLKQLDQSCNVPGLEEDYEEYLVRLAAMYGANASLVKKLEQHLLTDHPNGNWRFDDWFRKTMDAKTAAEKSVWLTAFQMAFANSGGEAQKFAKGSLAPHVLKAALQASNWPLVSDMLKLMSSEPASFPSSTQLLNGIVGQWVKKDTIPQQALDCAAWAWQACNKWVQLAPDRMPEQSPSVYRAAMASMVGATAENYAAVLLRSGKSDSACTFYGIAAAAFKYQRQAVNTRYFQLAEGQVAPTVLVQQLEKAISNNGTTDSLHQLYLRVAPKAGIAEAGKKLQELLAASVAIKKAMLKSQMIKEKAPAFVLKDLKENSVSLKSLKGSVVVLDFWATWCKPCVASFPAMQQVVDQYAVSDKVKIFFVNTWQREPNKKELVANFINDKKFRFDVLMDVDNKTVADFSVSGIPTKFVIDQQGYIRFKSSGYLGDVEKTREEMQLMIEMAAE